MTSLDHHDLLLLLCEREGLPVDDGMSFCRAALPHYSLGYVAILQVQAQASHGVLQSHVTHSCWLCFSQEFHLAMTLNLHRV